VREVHVAVIGAGYVGLVSGACLASFGHRVTCVDQDERKIDALQKGVAPIYEPGLTELIGRAIEQDCLFFTRDLGAAVRSAEVVLIAVGTPSRAADGLADLKYVYQAAREIAAALDGYKVIVTKSTVPVGTGRAIARIIGDLRPDATFGVVSNPEFLREGSAIHDFMCPDRLIIGTEDERARTVMHELYRPLIERGTPVVSAETRGAELIKYAANAFLATKITFINEIADLCEQVGANVQEVALGIGLDSRIGAKCLSAGPGYGGSCFPKDLLALMRTGVDFGAPIRSIETIVAINEQRKRTMARKIIAACGGEVRGQTIAILGLTFKPNTDDMREAQSIVIINALLDAGANVRAYDPKGMEQARELFGDIEFASDAHACMRGADALVVMTEWDEFRQLQPTRIKQLLRRPLVIDLRNIFGLADMAAAGIRYESVGRPPVGKAIVRKVSPAKVRA
jgi:UDPglucose 6-dehydrogenase